LVPVKLPVIYELQGAWLSPPLLPVWSNL